MHAILNRQLRLQIILQYYQQGFKWILQDPQLWGCCNALVFRILSNSKVATLMRRPPSPCKSLGKWPDTVQVQSSPDGHLPSYQNITLALVVLVVTQSRGKDLASPGLGWRVFVGSFLSWGILFQWKFHIWGPFDGQRMCKQIRNMQKNPSEIKKQVYFGAKIFGICAKDFFVQRHFIILAPQELIEYILHEFSSKLFCTKINLDFNHHLSRLSHSTYRQYIIFLYLHLPLLLKVLYDLNLK